jgi:hypothetical protein
MQPSEKSEADCRQNLDICASRGAMGPRQTAIVEVSLHSRSGCLEMLLC